MKKNDYVVAIVSKILATLVAVLYSSLTARYMGPAIKGEIAYITGYTTVISIILTFGIHQAYPHYKKSGACENIKDMFVNNVLLLMAVYFAISLILALIFRNSVEVMLIVLLSPLFAYTRVIGYLYLVEEASKKLIITLVVELIQIIYILFLILCTQANLLLGISILVMLDIVLSIIFTWKLKVRISKEYVDFSFLKKIISYGIIPMITLLISTLNYRIDVLMLPKFSNITMDMVGIYSIGVLLAEKVLLFPETLKEVLLSKLSKGAKDSETAKVMRICAPICIFSFIGIFIMGKPVINILFGAAYENSFEVTSITMFGVVSIMYYKMVTVFNIVNNKQKFNLCVLSSSVVINVILNIIFIPRFGIIGASLATVVSYNYCAIIFLKYFSKKTNIRMRDLIFINKEDVQIIKALLQRKKA